MYRCRHDWISDPVVLSQLDSLEEALKSAAEFQPAGREFHRQLLSDRSKRIRPALLFLSARFGLVRDQGLLVRAATATEQVHGAYNGAVLPQPVRREMGAVGRTLCRGQMREIASMGDLVGMPGRLSQR